MNSWKALILNLILIKESTLIADLTQVTDMPTSHSILASSSNSTLIGSNKTDKENMIISHLNKKTEKSIINDKIIKNNLIHWNINIKWYNNLKLTLVYIK